MHTHPIRRYPTSLSDEEWEQIKSLVPRPKSGKGKRGRPISLERRELVDAIFYIVRSGCAWRLLPSDFGSWQTVLWLLPKVESGLDLEICSRRAARLPAQE